MVLVCAYQFGLVRMTEALRFTGKIQSAIVNRDADRWFIAISVEIRDPKQTRPQGKPIGVDFGLSAFATLSTGQKIQAPKPLQRALRNCGGWADGTLASNGNHGTERRPAGSWLVNIVVSEISVMTFCTNAQPISLKPTAPSESRT